MTAKYTLSYLFSGLACLLSFNSSIHAQSQENGIKQILQADSLFWVAYNSCDVEGMSRFISDDIEFYHDKGGILNGKAAFIETSSKNLCSNKDWKLRREAVPGTVAIFPMKSRDSLYGALLSGNHYFYINETGKKEVRDGLAKFLHLWRLQDGQWKMTRIFSYDHGPAPDNNNRKTTKPAVRTQKK